MIFKKNITGNSIIIRIDLIIKAMSVDSFEKIEALVTTCAVDCKEEPAQTPKASGARFREVAESGSIIINTKPINVLIHIALAMSFFLPLKICEANDIAAGPQIQLPARSHNI